MVLAAAHFGCTNCIKWMHVKEAYFWYLSATYISKTAVQNKIMQWICAGENESLCGLGIYRMFVAVVV